jgi:hypothetical protein
MKRINIFFLLTISFLSGISQNNATDFSALDCDGVSHQLFSELDSGKVIVIAWVMPCGPCGSIALDAYAAALGYANSNPGRLDFYLVDDFANTPCQSLFTWADNFGMANCMKFSDPSIDMGDYGQIGMPKIVVVGGAGHYVYFNKNGSTQDINSAIDLALTGAPVTTNINKNEKITNFNCYPNPANKDFNISYSLKKGSKLKIELYNLIGEKVFEEKVNLGTLEGVFKLNSQRLPNGSYVIKLLNGDEEHSEVVNIFH